MEKTLGVTRPIAEILKLLPTEETHHMLRVGILVEHFTQELLAHGVIKDPCKNCKYFGAAAFYHDIGKAWIPHEILTKPDKLTETETLIMRNHPVFAQKLFVQLNRGIIVGIPEHLIQLARDAAMYHHEWWDGNGYPYGMKQDEIPLIASITSICDAYDAMTSNRVYRNRHSRDHAHKELLKHAGTQFNPHLVQAFLAKK
ncbi:HD domain-containing protein [Aminipila butyrica]|uniref:HD domain-containing protein n=1 Tax=Aminipila butyrica TaxID=433296 RepID=A0A858BQB4_9FIRM|nr:HD domain-containing phosphohydrolase [Aminipila butyrica]QIB67993.1 HD domain-containing protein [Aminipila butyrica]